MQKLFIKDRIPHGWLPVSRYAEIEVPQLSLPVVLKGCRIAHIR